ncbi:VCBS repeat-containing protein [Chaetoceros tenuissimus]|uniref:VCBS repeat-containing protein n=1 Tax=Chaetoceros tenuissimus TaxID=426638 RepID=A0AAD3DE69_9STRA|nr:VCBS repeat-containing protein [Chaetoceros tenuissimus]
MKFKNYALAIVSASVLVPPLQVLSESTHGRPASRYLNEDQPFQFSSSAHVCLLAYDMVQCVGYNYYGQLGQPSSDAFGTPVLLNFPNSITAKPKKVVTGYDHTCTLFQDGHVWCNGSNGFQQLGDETSANSATPIQVKKGSVLLVDVIDIEAGAYHNCAIQNNGAMYCWGFNADGQLGMNSIMDGSSAGKKTVQMALSMSATCVITEEDSTKVKSLLSMQVGEYTGHAIFDDKSVHSVGTNRGGTFGDGSTIDSQNIIGDLTNVIAKQISFVIGSDEPSLEPQSSPSTIPSLSPSNLPSISPSLSHSNLPSLSPSLSPSDSPSLSLSLSPSSSPSNLPSLSLSPTQVPDLTVDHYNYNRGWRIEKHVRLLADVNGDGKPDIVGFPNSGVVVTLSTPSYGFETPTYMLTGVMGYDHGWRVEYHPRFVEDVNGDGRADIIGFYNDGVYVSYSESTGFTPPVKMYNDFGNSTGWTVEDHPRFVTDMNGDGKADLVAFGNYDVYVAFANDNGFGAKKKSSLISLQD